MDIVRVSNLSGETIAEVSPTPAKVHQLKTEIQNIVNVPIALQRLLLDTQLLEDDSSLDIKEAGITHITFIEDESPLFSWDFAGNPRKDLLNGEDRKVTFVDEQVDYVNVITKEPVRCGVHYFEFVMHQVLDEQWCGLTAESSRAGYRSSQSGWFYYSGRRYQAAKGALHAPVERKQQMEWSRVSSGDVIGMLVDMQAGAVAFMLNGEVQGACTVSKDPLYLTTSLDRTGDSVELRKHHVKDAPAAAFEALQHPVLLIDSDAEDCDSGDSFHAFG